MSVDPRLAALDAVWYTCVFMVLAAAISVVWRRLFELPLLSDSVVLTTFLLFVMMFVCFAFVMLLIASPRPISSEDETVQTDISINTLYKEEMTNVSAGTV